MNVILQPLVTEKTVEDMKKGKYAFKVERDANKTAIKNSIQSHYKVDVLDISTINIKERKRKTMQKRTITQPAWKKAIVKIKAGQKIDVFSSEKK